MAASASGVSSGRFDHHRVAGGERGGDLQTRAARQRIVNGTIAATTPSGYLIVK